MMNSFQKIEIIVEYDELNQPLMASIDFTSPLALTVYAKIMKPFGRARLQDPAEMRQRMAEHGSKEGGSDD